MIDTNTNNDRDQLMRNWRNTFFKLNSSQVFDCSIVSVCLCLVSRKFLITFVCYQTKGKVSSSATGGEEIGSEPSSSHTWTTLSSIRCQCFPMFWCPQKSFFVWKVLYLFGEEEKGVFCHRSRGRMVDRSISTFHSWTTLSLQSVWNLSKRMRAMNLKITTLSFFRDYIMEENRTDK